MQRNLATKSFRTPVQLTIVGVVLALGATCLAQSDDPAAGASVLSGARCSNHTLFGNYGYSAEGQVLPAPGLAFPFTSTGMVHFDGQGAVSWVEHTVIGGAQQGADWTPASGSYIVKSDCTGSMAVVTPNSPVPLNIFFSIIEQGKQFYSVVNGHAISGVWTRIN
jgi:hypothetical protein